MELTNRQQEILKILQQTSDYMNSSFLADVLGISMRTVKSDIYAMNQELYTIGCVIESKPGQGYRLLGVIDKSDVEDNRTLPLNFKERFLYVIRKLLVIDYHVKIEDLADELAISRNTMRNVMKEVRCHLKSYDLKLVSRTNYGLLIEGSETNKRLAISEYFFHFNMEENESLLKDRFTGAEKEELLQLLHDICNKYHIDLSRVSMENLVIHLMILVRRVRFYNYTVYKDVDLALQDSLERKVASEIVRGLEAKYHFVLPIGEIIYVAQHLRCKRILNENKLTFEQEKKLKDCLYVMLSEIDNNFQLNLSEDRELYQYLYLHIPQMVERLCYHMTIRNPLVEENKRRYLFATKVTHSACAIIERFYHVTMCKDEFGYLLLYFNLAIMKWEENRKMKIGFLGGGGRSEVLMYTREMETILNPLKYEIQTITDLKEAKKLDLLVSSYPVDVACPLYLIRQDSFAKGLLKRVRELPLQKIAFDTYFKKENMVFDIEAETQDEVLKKFSKILYDKNMIQEIPKEHDGFLIDELGNEIVHLQDSYRIVRKNVCFIATLKHSVLFGERPAKILILTKTKRDHDKDLFELCKVISRFVNKPEFVNRFYRDKDFDQFYKELLEMGKQDDSFYTHR